MAVQRFDGDSLFDAKDTRLYSSGRRQLLYEPIADTQSLALVRHCSRKEILGLYQLGKIARNATAAARRHSVLSNADIV
jgi:hypothetical protein